MNNMTVIASSHLVQAKVLEMILCKLGCQVEILENLFVSGGIHPCLRRDPPVKILFTDVKTGQLWLPTLRSGGFRGSFIALHAGKEGDPGTFRSLGFDDSLLFPVSKNSAGQLIARLSIPGGQAPVGNIDAEENSLQIFSAKDLGENFMGNLDLVKSLLARFIERTEHQISVIPGIAEKGDWETARRDAHTIKGSARSMSGMELGDAALHWEEACKKQDLDAVKALKPDMEEVFAHFKAAAEDFILGKNNAG
jgi:HPt (histidine-containing phosphotransfer) domain-containing protein